MIVFFCAPPPPPPSLHAPTARAVRHGLHTKDHHQRHPKLPAHYAPRRAEARPNPARVRRCKMAAPYSSRTMRQAWAPTISPASLGLRCDVIARAREGFLRAASCIPPQRWGDQSETPGLRILDVMVAKYPNFCGGHPDCPGRYGSSLCHCGYAKDPAGRSVYGSDYIMAPLPEEPEDPSTLPATRKTQLPASFWVTPVAATTDATFPSQPLRTQLPMPPSPLQGAATISPARAVTSRHQTKWGPPRPRRVTQNARRAGKNSVKKPNYAWLETGMPRLGQQAQAWSGLMFLLVAACEALRGREEPGGVNAEGAIDTAPRSENRRKNNHERDGRTARMITRSRSKRTRCK